MEYKELEKKRDFMQQNKDALPDEVRAQMDLEFSIDYTYNSLALSGSSLTRDEVAWIIRNPEKVEKMLKEREGKKNE